MGRSPSLWSCSKQEDGINRGAWTASEDKILSEYVKTHGVGRWRSLPIKTGLKRCAKSCRLRWLNYLRPDIKRGNISPEEEELLIRLYRLLGNRWALIAGRLPGRTDNEIKNYWNTHLSKRIQKGEFKHKFQNHFKRKHMPSDSNYGEDRVVDKNINAGEDTPSKATGEISCARAVGKVDNLDKYNQDNVPVTNEGINQEGGLRAADDNVVEIDTSKSWLQLLLEDCMGEYHYNLLQPNIMTNTKCGTDYDNQFPSPTLGRDILLQENGASSCNFFDQEFPHSKEFISPYSDNCLDLGEPSFVIP
eukprot:PITA_02499